MELLIKTIQVEKANLNKQNVTDADSFIVNPGKSIDVSVSIDFVSSGDFSKYENDIQGLKIAVVNALYEKINELQLS